MDSFLIEVFNPRPQILDEGRSKRYGQYYAY
jgi:hypothetical protein